MERRRSGSDWFQPNSGVKGGTAGDEPPVAVQEPPPPPPPPATATSAPPPPDDGGGRRRPPGATAGIVLIVIGALILLFRFMPGLAWWTLWPLIIVIAGAAQMFTPGKEGWSAARLFDGLTTVAFGLFFLAITTGAATWGAFGVLLSLWPVLLIAIGFDLLGKALHSTVLRAIGSLAIIGALVFAAAGSVTGNSYVPFTWQSGEAQTATLDETGAGVTDAKLTVDAGAATVKLGDGIKLIQATGSSPYGEPQFNSEISGSSAEFDLSLGQGQPVVGWSGGPSAKLEAQLSRTAVWDMTINTGVSQLNADLSSVNVRAFELKPGIADCDVMFGPVPAEVDEAAVTVKSGISSVRLAFPTTAEVRIESDSGLTGHDIDSRYQSVDSRVWETAGWDEAKAAGRGVYLVSVKSGIGSVTIDSY